MKITYSSFKFIRIITLFILCSVFWIFLSEDLNIYSIVAGMLFSLMTAYYSYNIYIYDTEVHRSAFFFRIDLLFFFLIYIFVESYISTYHLIKLIIKRDYNPGVIRIKTRLRSDIGRVVLANSISLVPGTLSLWQEGAYIYVHWYDLQTVNSIKAGKLIKSRLEKFISRIFQ